MVPGEIKPARKEITINEGKNSITLKVANTGDRAIQVGSHYHFFEVNKALKLVKVGYFSYPKYLNFVSLSIPTLS